MIELITNEEEPHGKYEREIAEEMAKLALLNRGEKGKRAKIKMDKIIEDNLLYEEDPEEAANDEVFIASEGDSD